jgi:4-hydroxythreonine-4-phosphate dehydrogenase
MPLLAVTPGEPSGVGPEIVLRLVSRQTDLSILAVADPLLMRQTAEALDINVPIREWTPGGKIDPNGLACLPVSMARQAVAGIPDPANSDYVLETLRQAVKLVQQRHAGALVTGPVHKGIINESGTAFSGHTEFLAGLSSTPRVVMMLATETLRVALVTTHLPLRDVSDAITPEAVGETIRITHASLRNQFGIAKPRIQVLGLNPHAGEGGHLGSEDDGIIAPVIGHYRAMGMDLDGPVPADTAFTPPRLDACDAVIAMYHDQGLPVLKHAGFGSAVNITLGLPFIRTSVDHGTALDIAGKGIANDSSLLRAAMTARRLCQG